MRTIDLTKPSAPEQSPRGLFEGELMDLYVAIVIVVPLAMLMKSLLY